MEPRGANQGSRRHGVLIGARSLRVPPLNPTVGRWSERPTCAHITFNDSSLHNKKSPVARCFVFRRSHVRCAHSAARTPALRHGWNTEKSRNTSKSVDPLLSRLVVLGVAATSRARPGVSTNLEEQDFWTVCCFELGEF